MVQVRYRNHELAATAPISVRDDGAHRLELDDPPPVRTVLAITGDGRTRAFEVREVVEAASEGASRGCVLVEVALDRLPHTVGTEDRPAGLLGTAESEVEPAPVPEAGEGEGDGYGAHMAVPAPVVNDDDDVSGPVLLGDSPDGDGDSPEGDGNGEDDGNASVPPDDGNATPDGGSGRAKKRRGRQRR